MSTNPDNHRQGNPTANGGPSWRELFHGAARESLAAVHSVARIGTQDTRAWERPMRYVADDNQGNVGVVEFLHDGVVGAISARAPKRLFEPAGAIDLAPSGLREALGRVCELPLLQEGLGVSAAFWTVGDFLQTLGTWGESGTELFRRELLPGKIWEVEALAYYKLVPEVAHLAIAIASRAVVHAPLATLSEGELIQLIPKGSRYEREAIELLLSDGLFEVAHSATV